MATITGAEAAERLKQLSGWTLEGQAIRRQFTFDGFRQAIAFVVRLGFEAEEVDHHPDILINYKRVTLTFTTHSEGGLTGKDFAGAARATEIATSIGGR
ncbi:MAG TPA: 4a-hydroxytetrahydrobiopterin dehydratase [Vicinamibacterales bacterium]|nr:4a-hydroxytetrahydrobiopterin dehydratase [Vicinamibacterales bacterium]